MGDEQKTATQIVLESYADRVHERRDRRTAEAIAVSIAEQYCNPDEVESVSDIRRAIHRAALMAAYEAMRAERSLHAADLEMVKRVIDTQDTQALFVTENPFAAAKKIEDGPA